MFKKANCYLIAYYIACLLLGGVSLAFSISLIIIVWKFWTGSL